MRLSALFGHFTAKIVIPVFAIAAVVGVGVAGLLMWSSQQTDHVAIERQERLVQLVVSQLQTSIAHNQESVTVWDDAVRAVRDGADREWLDYNLGEWMHTYFGHDGAFILDPAGKLVYAFSTEIEKGEEAFAEVAGPAAPLLKVVRTKMLTGDMEGVSDRMLSPGASDLVVVHGHPAVVSVKPIVSDTGDIEQTPGEEYLHVAIRYLDGDFVTELEGDYLFEGMRFAWTDERAEGEEAMPLQAVSGQVIGYFIWQPYKPGEAVLYRMAPVLLVILGLVLVTIATLLLVINQRSKKLKASEARMQFLALHDPLTGLPNRALFDQRLDDALRAVREAGARVAVLYLDLDRFKHVNDTLGHPVGDMVIREFAERLKALTGRGDTVARIGGDEFIVIMPKLRQAREVETLCQRIVETLERPFEVDGHQVFSGVSIGVAFAPAHGAERTELTRKADIALYHAKSAGRSRYAIFGNAMDAVLQTRRDIERDLRLAMGRKDEISIHYQPRYAAEDMRITGVEALLRWNHPTKGWISPSVFVSVAEETGLVEALGELVMREACKAAVLWSEVTVSVNTSVIELRNPGFAAKVGETLRACGLHPRRLEIEVTEGAISDNVGHCEQNIRALREMGVQIALDDFGTGFSSLGRLKQLQVDRIKIDRSFVHGFGRLSGDEAIVQAMIHLARARGLRTTAEGVETREQSDYLKQVGCDELQGFLFSSPVTLSQIDALLGVKRRTLTVVSSVA
ncbi:putative bifunctional diguanylate cyclase/phosphodiesterase [Chelativorans salis]|uniref:EAL domain-containing protein n=1 Tax=Chelativorans salis TaxID=2978478 RepID=A0ABT2LNB7_9HYPH|nr:EAL domain-containing protein [Chelativorans sp. EGI FJ00035]MCT7374898.1 EAL domain-containing protein [Chelativorans sp. EGI FJ00035]